MYALSTASERRRISAARHTAGRIPINGRSLRYEAGFDICCFTLQVLREFVADYESDFFHCINDHINCIHSLVQQGEALRQEIDGGDLDGWRRWLRDVADHVPSLWD